MDLCADLTVLLIVNCIIKGILATSLRYTSRIRKQWCSLLYINS